VTANFYVWYRIEGDDAECELSIRSMMARLTCRTGISGQLMKKCDDSHLWMEVYEGVCARDDFQARLAQAVDEFDIEMFIDGPRHTECFVGGQSPIPMCNVAA
jgi:hypothetical protein